MGNLIQSDILLKGDVSIDIWNSNKVIYGNVTKTSIEGFEYPYVNGQNPLKSTLNSFEKRGYSKSSIDNSITNKIYPAEVNYVIRDS